MRRHPEDRLLRLALVVSAMVGGALVVLLLWMWGVR